SHSFMPVRNRSRNRLCGQLPRSAQEGLAGGGGHLRGVLGAEQAGVNEEGVQLVQRDAGAPAIGQRDGLVVGAQDLVQAGAPNSASIARSVSRWPPCAAG